MEMISFLFFLAALKNNWLNISYCEKFAVVWADFTQNKNWICHTPASQFSYVKTGQNLPRGLRLARGPWVWRVLCISFRGLRVDLSDPPSPDTTFLWILLIHRHKKLTSRSHRRWICLVLSAPGSHTAQRLSVKLYLIKLGRVLGRKTRGEWMPFAPFKVGPGDGWLDRSLECGLPARGPSW